MPIASGVAGVERGNLDGSLRVGASEILVDLERAFKLGELAADVAMPMCLTAKPTLECTGSTLQVPAGIAVEEEAVLIGFSDP